MITVGDEDALLPSELEPIARSVTKVRRASGAARIAARTLMTELGQPGQPVPRATSGAPQWPNGLVGSLAHDATVAVAALASSVDFMSIGIDIEPAERLDPELLDIVASPNERTRVSNDPFGGRVLFAAKEAVYKATYPLDNVFLEHHDVEVDLVRSEAVVSRTGLVVPLRFSLSSHIVALAFIPHPA